MANSSKSWQDRISRGVVRSLVALPPGMKRRLAGKPIRIDGQELHVDAQLGLRLIALGTSKSFEELPLAESRAQIESEAWVFGDELPIATIQDLALPGPAGPLPARLYRAADTRLPAAGLVYFHGGGWVVGDLSAADSVSRFLAQHAGLTVISVDYRLAPEHPFPAAVDDCVAAFTHIARNAGDYGLAPGAIGVGGESAGGNLAAVVSLETARAAATDPSAPTPALQVLFMPVTDLSTRHHSYELFGEGFFLTAAQMDWYQGHYLSDPEQASDPRVSPLLAGDVSGVAPAYVVTAGFDPLRDEGEGYAAKLAAAGVDTTLRRHPHLTHSMLNATGVGRVAQEVLLEATGVLRTRLTARAETPHQGEA